MKKVIIYHNPRCSKSRETLALLKDHGIAPEVVEYLKTPPTRDEVKALIAIMGGDAHALVRTKEAAYADSGLNAKSSADEIAAAIDHQPVLMERPLVVCGEKAVLGRPPEKVLEIL